MSCALFFLVRSCYRYRVIVTVTVIVLSYYIRAGKRCCAK